jgi:aminodeoxyfutalosine deaminase
MSIHDYIKKMPKAELHVHMEGSISPETLLLIAESNKISLPFSSPEEIRKLFNFNKFRDFVRIFLMFVHCLRKPEDFSYVIYRMGAEMNRQNIRYAEITWTPQFYLRLNFSLDIILEALNAGRHKAKAEWGVDMRWIPDLVRSIPKPMFQVQQWASNPYSRDNGVVALGLGGPE